MQSRIVDLEGKVADLERELQAIRRQARRSRAITLSLLAVGALFVATRPAATQAGFGTRIKGTLTVVDHAGKPVLQIGSNPLGRGMLLFDATGKRICGIGQTAQGRGLVTYDTQEKLTAAIGEGPTPDGAATGRGLTVFDPAQKIIGTLGTGINGPSFGRGLTLNDEAGVPTAGLGVWRQHPDRGQLVITDRNGTALFAQPPLP